MTRVFVTEALLALTLLCACALQREEQPERRRRRGGRQETRWPSKRLLLDGEWLGELELEQ